MNALKILPKAKIELNKSDKKVKPVIKLEKTKAVVDNIKEVNDIFEGWKLKDPIGYQNYMKGKKKEKLS